MLVGSLFIINNIFSFLPISLNYTIADNRNKLGRILAAGAL
jgi:hypothetical protein